MTQNTGNSSAVIRAQVYSQFMVENLPEMLLPEGFTRDVSDFGDGTTLNIPTVGTVTLQEAAEGVPLTFNPIDSGTVTLTIQDYPGDAWSVSDELKEDGYLTDRLMMERSMESTRAMGEHFETRFMEVCEAAQTNDDPNTINGARHRYTANGTSRVITLEDFSYMKFAFDKAKVPQAGRIAIVDPAVELTLNNLYNASWTVNNPKFEGIVTSGFEQNHKFVTNIFGFDIWTSNLLAVEDAAQSSLTDYAGNTTATVAGDIANVFMCAASDQTKPIMKAWRRQPSITGWRDEENREDRHQATSRFGLGAQRLDTLGVVYTNPSAV